MSKADYLENKLLDLVLGGQAFQPASTVYIALFTTLPADDGTGGTEVSGTGYARQAVSNDLTTWGAASSGTKTNAAAIQFPMAGGSWGTVVGFAVYDAPTSGNIYYIGSLVVPTNIASGQSPRFSAGSFIFSED